MLTITLKEQLDRIEYKLDALIAALSEDDEQKPAVDLEGNEYEQDGETHGTLS